MSSINAHSFAATRAIRAGQARALSSVVTGSSYSGYWFSRMRAC